MWLINGPTFLGGLARCFVTNGRLSGSATSMVLAARPIFPGGAKADEADMWLMNGLTFVSGGLLGLVGTAWQIE